MAKRRRLDPTAFLGAEPAAEGSLPPAGEGDLSRAKGSGRALGPPIAQAAGEAAAQAALGEVAATLAAAREEGRLVLRIPLDAIEEGHLVRDRLIADPDLSRAKGIEADPIGPAGEGSPSRAKGLDAEAEAELWRRKGMGGEAMADLKVSLRARGQQTPIEVAPLPPGADGEPRWGLISGWRRLAALRALHAEELAAEEGDPARFATALALVRRPQSAAEAYVAMVEENEVRQDLSFWERARVVRRAVEAGAFPDEGEALRALFASATYARRSKIKSFLPVVAALEGRLRHPEAIGERLGLALARILAEDPGFADWIATFVGPGTTGGGTDAASEVGFIAALVAAYDEEKAERQGLLLARPDLGPGWGPTGGGAGGADGSGDGSAPRPFARERSGHERSGHERGGRGGRAAADPGSDWLPVRDGLSLRVRRGRIEIAGPRATPGLAERLQAWLRSRG